tara:strand:- start:50160 stop:51419 length:1260 start_codon:yes stop_codon:yes gene_type:complete
MIKLKLFHNMVMTAFASFILAGCSDSPPSNSASSLNDEEAVEEVEVRGPNGGILLENDNFTLEVTIFETGMPPQYRLYAYENGEAISPNDFQATIILGRLDGEQNIFKFKPEGTYLSGDNVVVEPHSFNVNVEASFKGKNFMWQYPSYEGRTQINSKMATVVGLGVDTAGPAVIEETVELLGDIEFAPNARSVLKANYPGKILSVFKFEGQQVKKGDVLARIESNASLQSYEIISPLDGVIVSSTANEGDVVNEEELFVIGDLSRLRIDFHVYAGDHVVVQPGQTVKTKSMIGDINAETTLENYLPVVDMATQTTIIHAELPNPDLKWFPGMKVEGTVVTNLVEVPLAVKTEALQRFRDFTVVFAQIGDMYEVRMLEIGRQTSEWTEVLSGIKPGQAYVSENSFIVKADVEKSGASHDH